jgi:hypothetical protein
MITALIIVAVLVVLFAAFLWVMSGDLGLDPRFQWMWTWQLTYGVLFTARGFPVLVLEWTWGSPPPWKPDYRR